MASLKENRDLEKMKEMLFFLLRTECMSPPAFPRYSLLTEFSDQIALGVFQILKALILTRPIKISTKVSYTDQH